MKKLFNSIAVAALLGAAPLMTACADRTGDTATDVQARVNDNLKTANLDDVKADWKADEKALHLSGEVESAADKARAEESFKAAVGVDPEFAAAHFSLGELYENDGKKDLAKKAYEAAAALQHTEAREALKRLATGK